MFSNLIPVSPKQVDAAIVDLDGTMVDTLGDFAEAINRTLADMALPAIEPHHIERMVGKGSEHLLRSVLQHVLSGPGSMQQGPHASHTPHTPHTPHAPDPRKIDALYETAWAHYQRHYLAINGQFAATYPGVLEGLQSLKSAGLRLACLTNKPTSFAVPLLQAKGLSGFFDHVFGGDAFDRKKPDPLPLLKTCEALGTVPARTLMIGDSSNDAQAARAAGCPVVLVTYGYNHGQPARSVDADGYVDSLAECAQC